MNTIEIRAMIRHKPTGRIGVIMANESAGGVFRGHADVWLGEVDAEGPVVFQVYLGDWEQVECPKGSTLRTTPDEFSLKTVDTINAVNEGDITATEALARLRKQ